MRKKSGWRHSGSELTSHPSHRQNPVASVLFLELEQEIDWTLAAIGPAFHQILLCMHCTEMFAIFVILLKLQDSV